VLAHDPPHPLAVHDLPGGTRAAQAPANHRGYLTRAEPRQVMADIEHMRFDH
jgi:hypothetical protein